MARGLTWVAVALLILGAAWIYRARRVDAAEPRELVRGAWTTGRRVPLKGRWQIEMGETGGKPVQAEVLISRDGYFRIKYLTQPLAGVTIWENGERTYRYNPKLKRLTVSTRRRSEDQELQDLLENYHARVAGEEVVAGHPAAVVELRPKSNSDRWRRIWVDRETSVLLAVEHRKGKEEVLRSTRFTEVRYLPPSEQPAQSEFQPPAALMARYGTARPGDTSSRFSPAQLSRLIGFRVREPKWLPKGYRLKGAYQIPCPCDQHDQAARLEYSDGLNLITLFEGSHPSNAPSKNCFASDGGGEGAAVFQHQGMDYLAVGDAPHADLERMIQSATAP
jgi:anti-sigma factor RsiW